MKVIILLFLFIASSATSTSNSLDVSEAQRAYQEGLELYSLANPPSIVTEEESRKQEIGYARHGRDRNVLLEKSVVSFRQAVAINPKFAQAYNSLGNALRELGRKLEAIEAYGQAGKAEPTFPWGYKNIGDLYLKDKSYQEAILAYRRFLKIDQEYGRAEVHYKLGTVYEAMGQHHTALREFEAARDEGAPQEAWKKKAEEKIQNIQKIEKQ